MPFRNLKLETKLFGYRYKGKFPEWDIFYRALLIQNLLKKGAKIGCIVETFVRRFILVTSAYPTYLLPNEWKFPDPIHNF